MQWNTSTAADAQRSIALDADDHLARPIFNSSIVFEVPLIQVQRGPLAGARPLRSLRAVKS